MRSNKKPQWVKIGTVELVDFINRMTEKKDHVEFHCDIMRIASYDDDNGALMTMVWTCC